MDFSNGQGTVISRLELVLQKNVLQACVSLQGGYGAEFLSTNFERGTASKIKVTKQHDDSARICLTVSRLTINPPPSQPEHILIHRNPPKVVQIPEPEVEIEHTASLPEHTPKETPPCKDSDVQLAHIVDENAQKEEPTASDPNLNLSEVGCAKSTAKIDGDLLQKNDGNASEDKLSDVVGSPVPSCEMDVDLSDLTQDYISTGNNSTDGTKCNQVIPQDKQAEEEPPVINKIQGEHLEDNANTESKVLLPNQLVDEICDKNDKSSEKPQEGACLLDVGDVVPEGTIGPKVSDLSENVTNPEPQNPTAETDGLAKTKIPRKRPWYKRELNIPCKLCDSKLKDFATLYEHVKNMHGEDEGRTYLAGIKGSLKIQCTLCNKFYSRKEQLAVHINSMHKPAVAVKCKDCNLTVKSQKHLNDHIRRIHRKTERIHLCHLCPASFKVPSYLSDHLKYVHTSNSKDACKCHVCGKCYSTEKYMRNHISRVHGAKKHICKYCEKSYCTQTNLARHVILVHEKKGVKSFQCELCDRKFSLKANLRDHVLTLHHNIFPHRCSICKLGFRRRKEVETHVRHVHGPSPRKVTLGGKRLQPKVNEPFTVLPFQPTPQTIGQLGNHVESPQVDDTGIQYIVATPEILQAFGLQITPDLGQESVNHNDNGQQLPGDILQIDETNAAAVDGQIFGLT